MNSRDKGKRGERELAGLIGGRRGDNLLGSADVVGLEGFHVEVKRRERVDMVRWCEQAEADCGDGEVPLVAWRRNRDDWRVTLPLEAFLELLR